MPRNIVQAILLCFWLVLISIIYFLLLLVNGSLLLIISMVLLVTFCFFKWFSRLCSANNIGNLPDENNRLLPLCILLAGLIIIICKVYPLQEKYGHWDAWWFWNVRANYLSRPGYWHKAFEGSQYGTKFTVPVAHADYPPFLPLVTGCVWRMLNGQPAVVPYMFSMLSFLLITGTLFWDLYPKNKIVAIALLILVITNEELLKAAAWQTAEGWIALFFLLSMICYHYFRITGNVFYLVLTGSLLGCCMWVKNEGILLTVVFCLFQVFGLRSVAHWKRLIQGISVPLIVVLLFKFFIAPPNDLVAGQQSFPWNKITDATRYREIWKITSDMFKLYYPFISYVLGAYLVFCLVDKQRIDRIFLMIITCFAIYLSIYVVTPHNLEWHITTSVDRLIYHMVPAFLWVAANRFCKIGAMQRRPEVL